MFKLHSKAKRFQFIMKIRILVKTIFPTIENFLNFCNEIMHFFFAQVIRISSTNCRAGWTWCRWRASGWRQRPTPTCSLTRSRPCSFWWRRLWWNACVKLSAGSTGVIVFWRRAAPFPTSTPSSPRATGCSPSTKRRASSPSRASWSCSLRTRFPLHPLAYLCPAHLSVFAQCHYSVKSCAAVCGLGTDNCVEVPSDDK